MKKIKLIFVVFWITSYVLFQLCTLKHAEAGQGDAGTSVFTILDMEMGARNAAMGGSFTAVADEVSGIYSNPAGLSQINAHEISLQNSKLISNMDLQYGGYALPITSSDVLGFSGILLDKGKLPRITLTPSGDLAEIGTFTAGSYTLALSYSHKFLDILNAGFSLKFSHDRIDNINARAYAADVGVIYHTPIKPLRVALSIMNIGPTVKYISDREKLPLKLNIGVAYKDPSERWIFSTDMKKNRGEHVTFHTGGEFWLVPQFAFRAGYNSSNNMDNGFTLGTGFRVANYRLDYAYEPYGSFGVHQVSGALRFGMPVVEKIDKDRKEIAKRTEKQKATTKKSLLSELMSRKSKQKETTAPVEKAPDNVMEQPSKTKPATGSKGMPLSIEDAETHFASGRYKEASDIYNKIVQREPDHADAWYNLATCYYILQDYSDAEIAYKRYIGLKPSDSDSHFYLGNTYYYLGQVEKARFEWQTVLSIQPDNEMALKLLETTQNL